MSGKTLDHLQPYIADQSHVRKGNTREHTKWSKRYWHK